ncbi:hypothetical protein GF319_09305 [Candidatus Bathyarchaeota archaeon]|nr:hypothetical protein [Candidatus Bathyarchaeota archaeon]
MKLFRDFSIVLPFLGLALGYVSYVSIMFFVTVGMPNKVVGTITFPVVEELTKLSLTLVFAKIFNLNFHEAVILGFMTGVGFRFPEMGIKTKSSISFLLGSMGHGSWTCVGLKGYFRFLIMVNGGSCFVS